jgi:hypothetical protein
MQGYATTQRTTRHAARHAQHATSNANASVSPYGGGGGRRTTLRGTGDCEEAPTDGLASDTWPPPLSRALPGFCGWPQTIAAHGPRRTAHAAHMCERRGRRGGWCVGGDARQVRSSAKGGQRSGAPTAWSALRTIGVSGTPGVSCPVESAWYPPPPRPAQYAVASGVRPPPASTAWQPTEAY